MDVLAARVEMAALKRLKAEYFYYLDTKQWDDWLDLFTHDATLAWDSDAPANDSEVRTSQFSGHEAIRENVIRAILDPATTVHQGHTPILDLVSDVEARGIWAMEDIVLDNKGRGRTHGWGHYHETYRKVADKWRISSLHLTRLLIKRSDS